MKKMKLFFTFLLLLFTTNSFAQKSYLEVARNGNYYYLYGDVPQNLNINGLEYKKNETYGLEYARVWHESISMPDIINVLLQEGFNVDYYCAFSEAKNDVLMSRNTSSASSIQHIQSESEEAGEIREVARYNLQGMPIGKNEKGIQIIVYSNYTTKTVIVE